MDPSHSRLWNADKGLKPPASTPDWKRKSNGASWCDGTLHDLMFWEASTINLASLVSWSQDTYYVMLCKMYVWFCHVPWEKHFDLIDDVMILTYQALSKWLTACRWSFSCVFVFVFLSRIYWQYFQGVQLTIKQYCVRLTTYFHTPETRFRKKTDFLVSVTPAPLTICNTLRPGENGRRFAGDILNTFSSTKIINFDWNVAEVCPRGTNWH